MIHCTRTFGNKPESRLCSIQVQEAGATCPACAPQVGCVGSQILGDPGSESIWHQSALEGPSTAHGKLMAWVWRIYGMTVLLGARRSLCMEGCRLSAPPCSCRATELRLV